jgi:NodT family efflux transporter outer membrane factor (OMF) lipoprotein
MRLVCTLLGAAALSACAALPGQTPAPAIRTTAEFATERSFDAARGEWPADRWWTAYADPQLDALVSAGLAGSPSVAVADARLRRARAYEETSRAARAPQVNANAAFTEQKQSYNYLSPAAVTPQGWNDSGRASLDFSWELDFWGKNRAALAAATSDALAAGADVAQARLALSSAIASGYAELARLYAALDTASAARDLRARTAELFGKRYENGLETRGSVWQAQSRLAAGDADVLALQEQIELQKNKLAALIGAGPDRARDIVRPSVNFTRAFSLPPTLSAELIGRRPDLVAARLRAEAAARRIHVYRAQFYPNVNLAAFIGVQSLGVDMLTSHGSDIGSAGPAISLPIFNGGRLRAQLRGGEAEYAEAVANYDKTLVQALQEVADAAVSQRALAPQLERIDAAVDAAREAWRVQNDRYQGGLATYLDVLSAEDYLLGNLRSQSDLRSRSMTLDVALTRALGGGYQSSNPQLSNQ